MKYSLGMSSFLEEISSLSHPIVFLYFFALITKEGFLISSFCPPELIAFSWVYLSLSPLPFTSLLLSTICKAASDNYFAFLHFFFFGMILVSASCTLLQTSIRSCQVLCLPDLIPWIYLSTLLYNLKGFFFRSYLNVLVFFLLSSI